ncbi:MAG TPA: phage portal protein [Bryobacteraceae bacterium]|jgi:lambda family phage portal protein
MGLFTFLRRAFLVEPPKAKASTATGYDAGGHGRRAFGWNASPLGPNTLLANNLPTLTRRSRDAVRNSAIARSAIDKFESNVIGSGIAPHFLHPDEQIRTAIQTAWDRWVKTADYNGQLNFYGLQALLARELFEAGECFVRFHVDRDGSFSIQLIESEQLPIYKIQQATQEGRKNVVKFGIVFDENDRRIGYEMYKGQPFDTIAGSYDATTLMFVPADEMLHVMRPTRAGQLRGEPHMVSVLTLLKQIDDYSDSERERKKVASMFAGFITRLTTDDAILPMAPVSPSDPNPDPGTDLAKMEPGSFQYLMPGENITFPTLPESKGYAEFMYQELHKFAAGVGLTYEQLTGDLRGVNYSSIRAGVLEFRRACEQYQANVIIHQMAEPVMKRWLRESVLTGALELPDDYFNDPTPYEMATWVPPSWNWIDPAKEMAAYQMAVRSGFTSRTQVVREQGFDPEIIDAQQAQERQRAESLGIIYDSDPNKVLIGRESQPLTEEPVETDSDTDADATEGDDE